MLIENIPSCVKLKLTRVDHLILEVDTMGCLFELKVKSLPIKL